ncbi:MAG: hypothetical protein ACE5HO_18825 [bacterium]
MIVLCLISCIGQASYPAAAGRPLTGPLEVRPLTDARLTKVQKEMERGLHGFN